ncbi:MAG: C4-type zinc ribbon domain-containing protein [Armatimonadota bacterium]
MKSQLRALYELQQVDLQIAAANKALAALDNGAALRKQLSDAEKKLESSLEDIKKLESDLKDSELSLKSVETKKQNCEKKLYAGQVANPKELSSMEKEIEILGKSREKLDERILELYEAIEPKRAAANKLEDVMKQFRQHVANIVSKYQAKHKELSALIEQLNTERQKCTSAVTDRTILQRYESIKSRHKDTGLAKVENSQCGGCHVGLTPYAQRLLKEGEQYQICESCGRILFLVE